MKRFAIAGFLSLALTTCNVMAASPFEDIDPSHWAYPKIKFLYDHGIIRGTGTGKFDGNERISRYEAAALVYQGLQYVNRTRSQGGAIDADIMDTINSLMTELTDEMQVIEVRIEENSDAIAMLRNHIASMHGKPTQGVTVPMGQGRLKFMGQGMISLVSGGANSAYSNDYVSNNDPATATANPGTGATEFVNDYIMLGLAADIDERTSFFAKANVYTGGSANRSGVADGSNIISFGADGLPGGGDDVVGINAPESGLQFNDYIYVHVKDLWSDWDLTLGRMGLPWGHETGGAFRTNPYFASNSLVDMLYNNRLITGAYVSTESDDGEWNWGVGVHNGDQANPSAGYSHLYPAMAMATGVPTFLAANANYTGFTNFPVMAASTPGMNGVNNNEDESFGFLLHVGHRTANGDLRWDANYFMNGGSNTGDTGVLAGHMGMSYFNVGADYRINEDWAISGEFVSGSVETANPNLGANPGGRGNVGNLADDEFTTYYLQLVYNLDHKSTVAVRMSDHSYSAESIGGVANGAYTGVPDDGVTEMALAYTRKVSDNGTLLLEYSDVTWDLMGGFNTTGCEQVGSSCQNEFDVIRASYRVDF